MEIDLNAAMLRASFRPTRYAALVNLVRRVAWACVRPFHMFTLAAVRDLNAEQVRLSADLLSARKDALAATAASAAAQSMHDAEIQSLRRMCADVMAELAKCSQPLAEFRTELAAHRNRQQILVSDLTALADASEQSQGLLNDRIDKNEVILTQAIDAIPALVETSTQALISSTLTSHSLLNDRIDKNDAILTQAIDAIPALVETSTQALISSTLTSHSLLNDRIDKNDAILTQAIDAIPALVETSTQALISSTLTSHNSEQLAEFSEKVGSIQVQVDQVGRIAADAARAGSLRLKNAKEGLFILKAGDWISETVEREGGWDGHIIDLLDDIAATELHGVAIDVGAQFGLITVAMAKRFAKVISFEPNDFNYRIMCANVALNSLTNVECYNFPLYSSSVSLSLGRPEQQETLVPFDEQGRFDPMAAPNSASYLFSQTGLDEYRHQSITLDSMDLDNVVFIKIDVQGADGEVLMGALKTLKRCRPVVVFEWEEALSRQFTVTLDAAKQGFLDLGYRVHILKRHNEKQVDYIAYPMSPSK